MNASGTAPGHELGIARATVESFDGRTIALSFHGTNYQLHLTAAGLSGALTAGRRARGRIEASALRMHRATAGGRFIEPVYGHPRIVQGAVVEVDEAGNRLLLDVGVPMWVRPPANQPAATFKPGEMLNFLVQSGATFTAL